MRWTNTKQPQSRKMSRFHLPFVFGVIFIALLEGSYACNRPPTRNTRIEEILTVVRKTLPKSSFEVYDFKVGWYNLAVAGKFDLPYSDDTVALSTHEIPGVFKKSFLPFLCKKGLSVANDSWPQFTKFYMQRVQRQLREKLNVVVPDEDILYPHVMLGPRHPQILVQTAAHLAGAAFYYQRRDVIKDPWPENKTIYGASIHPKYGGWFYMGPVIILRNVKIGCLHSKKVEDVLPSDADKINMLNLANGNWTNHKWRNVISVEKKYTDEHTTFSMSYGEKRTDLVKKIYNDHCSGK